jgi:hypothetical protein
VTQPSSPFKKKREHTHTHTHTNTHTILSLTCGSMFWYGGNNVDKAMLSDDGI